MRKLGPTLKADFLTHRQTDGHDIEP